MRELLIENIYLILFLPLWIFLVVMFGRFFSVYVNRKLIYALSIFTSGISTAVCLALYKLFSPGIVYEHTIPFIKINDFLLPFGIHIDRLSLIFATVLFLISFWIQIFSISFMKDEKKQYKFWGLINLFNFSLAGLFFSPNLFQTYFFWEIVSVISYLLVGFEYSDTIKSIASKKIFIMNRIGDTALLGAIILCSYLMYEYASGKSLTSLPIMDINIISTLINAYTSRFMFILISGLFLLAAIVKSAQVPFYTWLQDAMEAKLPVSALLHSATLVALGGYLIVRLIPMFALDTIILKSIIVIGLLTALICSLSACAQDNPKRALAFSTSAQFGLMFFAIGLLNIKAGICLFCAHALTKSMLFTTLPDKDKSWSRRNLLLYAIGGLSLVGIILSGFMAKDILVNSLPNNYMIVLSVIAILTSFYITRLAFVITRAHGIDKNGGSKTELFANFGLLLSNICLYCYLSMKFDSNISLSLILSIITVILTCIIYYKNLDIKIPILNNICKNGFYLDAFYSKCIVKMYGSISDLAANFDKNVLENYTFIKTLSRAGVKIVFWIEENIMNRTVRTVAFVSKKISYLYSKMQNGNIQNYNLYAFTIITVLVMILITAYTTITIYFKGI